MKSRLLNILFWSVISAAFIGPGTVTTAAKAGADYGLSLLWALGFATLACMILQEAAARLTIISGRDLGQVIRSGLKASRGTEGIPGMAILIGVCILTGTAAYQTGNLLGAMAGIQLFIQVPSWMIVLLLGLLAGFLLMTPSVRIIARILGTLVALMGITFLFTAFYIKPPFSELVSGLFLPRFPPEGGLLVLGLVGTTVVPYNLFLGSGLSKGQTIKEMRMGLLAAVLLGGIISMAILVTGSAVEGEFSFSGLASALGQNLGRMGRIVLGSGLLAAGFTSAVTAPLASAVMSRSLFASPDHPGWSDGEKKFRLVWLSILLIGLGFGMAGFRPVPAIILAQALNGLILPLVAIYLMFALNSPEVMGGRGNQFFQNLLMSVVVFFTLVLGITGIVKALLRILSMIEMDWNKIMIISSLVSLFTLLMILLRIHHGKRGI